MRLLFQIIIIFSLISFGQKSFFSETPVQFLSIGYAELAHDHVHEFAENIKFILLGQIQHEHEHDHDEDSESSPWSGHHHDSRSHAHNENTSIRIDFLCNRNLFELSCKQQSSFDEQKNRIHLFEYNSEIFRPPISA